LYQKEFTQAKPSINDAWVWRIPEAKIDVKPLYGKSRSKLEKTEITTS
tara:strand:+ start:384 stop:527 length:144 start_codon:yes stop_codon:yes gene_type:complete